MENYKMVNLNLKELPFSESKDISGGFKWPGPFSIIGGCIYLFNNRADFIEGIKDGFNGVEYNY